MRKSYQRLRSNSSLWRAWRHVYGSGVSSSDETRRLLAAFKQDEVRNIDRLERQLRSKTFKFGPARGAPIPRPGKDPRPIVVASVEARIVQRALLEELHGLPQLKTYFTSPHSFGGVIGRNRAEAIVEVQKALESGAGFYVRSDISDFFTKIPRGRALEVLSAPLDPDATSLLDAATYLDLENAAQIHRHIHLFPTPEVGAGQGLCLSPLMGNVVLHEFDELMNGRGIRCIRYVDDFILLGPTEGAVMKAFDSALRSLDGLGMTAYDPRTNSSKAERGPTRQAIDFLGCLVERARVQPNRDARTRLVDRVKAMLVFSEVRLDDPPRAYRDAATISRTLYDVGNTVRGWKDSFNFCVCPDVYAALDDRIDRLVDGYLAKVRARFGATSQPNRRLLLGIPMLAS